MDESSREKMELRRRVGGQIRAYRESQGMTLHVLADMVGTSYTHIWKVEQAKVGVGLDLLGRISRALEVPLRDIVDPVVPPESSPTVAGHSPS